MASVGTQHAFKIITHFSADYCGTSFTLYESQKTGLRAVAVDSTGPKVNGYFALATEIYDDSGSPHTLEHLCFCGSRNHRFKGFLDKLAARAYSSTNAWTDTDQTVYQLDTAGWQGFNQMLPVYLDHLISPTLTDASCYTEVHHIDGAGQDAGVVYSEMQGRQNTQGDLMQLRRNRLLYKDGVGFRYETGGLMENLRALSADRIREFHRAMYTPKNMSLIVIGEINHEELLQTLSNFEDGLSGRVPPFDAPFDRPWMKKGKVGPLTENVSEVVEFPDEDEERGEIWFSYLGPDYVDTVGATALEVLLTYLAGSSIATLTNVIVEQESLASDISYYTEDRPDLLTTISLDGILVEDLDRVQQRYLSLLTEIAGRELNMDYLRDCLERDQRQVRYSCQAEPNFFHPSLIADHLYGRRDGTTMRSIGSLHEYDVLATWSEAEWRAFLKKWFVDCHWVCLTGKPSLELSSKIQEEEKRRLASQREEYGDEGLQKLAEKLAKAQAENEQKIPAEAMRPYKPPSPESIHFISTSTARSGLARPGELERTAAQRYIDSDDSGFPLYLHCESIPFNFVQVSLSLCTHSIPVQQRPLLQLYLEYFFETPVSRSGARIEFEQVNAQLEKETVVYTADRSAFNRELVEITFVLEPSKYKSMIDWIVTLLYDRIFDADRLITTIKKILANAPIEKRSGSGMARAVSDSIHALRESTEKAFSILVKDRYLRKILYKLQTDPDEVINDLQGIQKILTAPENLRLFLVTDLEGKVPLSHPVSDLAPLVKRIPQAEHQLRPIDNPRDTISFKPGQHAYVVPMKTLDSSFATITARGLDWKTDARYPAYSVAQAYMDAMEGPLWTAIRGAGLAYSTGFAVSKSKGLLNFVIYRSPDAHKAFVTARSAIEDIVNGKTEIDDFAFEGALSAAVVSVAEEQPNMIQAAAYACAYQALYGVRKDWSQEFLKRVGQVTQDEMKAALKDIFLPMFNPETANIVVTCSVNLEEKLVNGFRDQGFKTESRLLSSFEDDYGLEGDLAEPDLDEDMDEGSEDADENCEDDEAQGDAAVD